MTDSTTMLGSDAEISCRELVEVITDYIEDALPGQECARFESHVAQCDGCDAYLAEMRATIRLTGRLRAESLSPDSRERLLTLFEGWKQGAPTPSLETSPPRQSPWRRLVNRLRRRE